MHVLVDEEVSVLGTNNSQNLQENFTFKAKYDMNTENFRP